MKTMADDAGLYGKEFIDTGLKSFSQVAKSAQAIATEATDYTKASYESAAAILEKLFSVKSLDAAIQLQTDYAKGAYEGLVAETSKISGLYADMAREAYKPFESIVAKAK
jgi:hypothetical protein